MKQHRFFIPDKLHTGRFVINDQRLCHQLFKVLRFKPKEIIILFDQDGYEAEAIIQSIDDKQIVVSIEEINNPNRESNKHIVLYCAILKKENFDLVVQKATEVGVSRIVPLITERTIKQNIKMDRLQSIAREAAELCGRTSLPEILEVMDFKRSIDDAKNNKQNYFFHTQQNITCYKELVGSKIGLFIGPEGGWTDKEVEMAKQANFVTSSLSPLILRGETAAILATYKALASDSC